MSSCPRWKESTETCCDIKEEPFSSSFNLQGRYQERFLGPIQQSTVLVVDPAKGSVLKASGRNM